MISLLIPLMIAGGFDGVEPLRPSAPRQGRRESGGGVMKKDLAWHSVDFRSDRIVLPAEMFRRRRKIAHGILHKRSSAKVIIEHGTTKVEVA